MKEHREKIVLVLLIITGIIHPQYPLYFLWPLIGGTIFIGVIKLYGFIAKRTPDDTDEEEMINKGEKE